MEPETEAPDTRKRDALAACVARMKGLSGKLRDDAAAHFLAGVAAAGVDLGEATPTKYVDVLEALASA